MKSNYLRFKQGGPGRKFRKHFVVPALIGGIAAVILVGMLTFFDQPAQGDDNAGQNFSRAQIDQMLAPVALYPDSLLAQVLLASTYPNQVVEADRWVRAHRRWSRARINEALNSMDWDLSVKALVPFPKVLAMMDKHLNWTTNLGEAFLTQQQEVMASVQELRHKAYAQGNLNSTPQQKVVVVEHDIEIEPVNPDYVYVPYYNPLVVYGAWWWPGYPPFAYYPFGEPVITVGLFGWFPAVTVSPFWNWGWGYWNWGDRDVFINVNRTVNINSTNLNITRSALRTANLTRAAARGVADPVRTAALRHGGRAAAWRPPLPGFHAAATRAGGARQAGVAGRTGTSAAGARQGTLARNQLRNNTAQRTNRANFARGTAPRQAPAASGHAFHRPSAASIEQGLRHGGTASARGVTPHGANAASRFGNHGFAAARRAPHYSAPHAARAPHFAANHAAHNFAPHAARAPHFAAPHYAGAPHFAAPHFAPHAAPHAAPHGRR